MSFCGGRFIYMCVYRKREALKCVLLKPLRVPLRVFTQGLKKCVTEALKRVLLKPLYVYTEALKCVLLKPLYVYPYVSLLRPLSVC